MPRTARASQGGICYHVLNRGNRRERVFHEEADFEAFVTLIGRACERIAARLGLEFTLHPVGRPPTGRKK